MATFQLFPTVVARMILYTLEDILTVSVRTSTKTLLIFVDSISIVSVSLQTVLHLFVYLNDQHLRIDDIGPNARPNNYVILTQCFGVCRENLTKDLYLISQMDSDQFVPIWTIACIEDIKALTTDMDLILDVLRGISPSVLTMLVRKFSNV